MRGAVIALLILLALVSPALATTIVVPGLPPVVVPDPPYSGCVLYLPMDEGSGNITYNAVNPLVNNGTLGDGVNYMPTWVPGRLGYGLKFDDLDDYLRISDFTNVASALEQTNRFTVALWFKVSRNQVIYDYVFLVGSGYFRIPSITVEQNDYGKTYMVFRINTTSGPLSVSLSENAGTKPYNFDEWTFAVFRYDGNKLIAETWSESLGRVKAEKEVGDVQLIPLSGVTDYYIGHFSGGNNGALTVIIDEVMFYNRYLSDEEVQLLYQRGATHRFDTNITIDLRQISVPRLDLSGESATVEVSFDISADAAGTVWIPVPASAKILDNVEFAYGIDGKVLTIDDNRYVNASSVTVSIPISINTATEEELPNELYLDSDSKTFEFKKSIRIVNPSDISIMATLSVDPRTIGVANAYLDGCPMSLFNGSLISSIILGPGESKVMELTATLPISKQELEFRATLDDFFEIKSFDQAVKMAQSATEGKIETVTKVIAIDSADFKSFGNRTVIIPLDVKVSDVIEAKALTGSKELLEVREGKDGKAEIVVPATVFEGTPLGTQHAEIKVIYNKKPAWWERLPFLKSLGGFFEFLAKIFGFGR